MPTAQDSLPSIPSTLKAAPAFCAAGTATRTPATRDKLSAPKDPGVVRAASFCSDYDARSCASGPTQNCPHSLPPPCRSHLWPSVFRAGPTAHHSTLEARPGATHYRPEARGPRAPRDPIRRTPFPLTHQGNASMVFRSFFRFVLPLLHGSPVSRPSPPASSSGGRDMRCPLKTTPAGRPDARANTGEGRETGLSSRAQKKDHEDQEYKKADFRAQEPS